MTDSRPLRVQLEPYDGKHTDVLESLAERLGADSGGVAPDVWDEAIALVADPESRMAGGATWLIRRWIDGGQRPPASTLTALSQRLHEVTDGWARLHLVQALPSLAIPQALVPPWLELCRAGAAAEAPFLRAWSVNALVHLASIDPALTAEARAALETALADPKASVRARARKILEETTA